MLTVLLDPASLEGEDPFDLKAPGDTPPLVLWGRPGRENVRLLDQLSQSAPRASAWLRSQSASQIRCRVVELWDRLASTSLGHVRPVL